MKFFIVFNCLILPTIAQLDEGPWFTIGRPIVGTKDNRGVGEQVLHPSANVMVEAHHGLSYAAKGRVSPKSFEASVYLYEQALYDWIPFGESLKRDYGNEYDTATCKMDMQQSSTHSSGNYQVALLETFMSFDYQDEEITAYKVQIQTYTFRGGQWYESELIEVPDNMKDLDHYMWGADMVLSKNDTMAIGVPAEEGGFIQIYALVEDPWGPDKWEPLGIPLMGGSSYFGYVVDMSNDGNIILGLGCQDDDDDEDDDETCYIRAFQFNDSSGGQWSQIGRDINGEEFKLRPGDGLAIDGETGLTFVVGSREYDPDCNMSKMGGHVKVFEFDQTKNDWIQKGQDLDSLMDFKGAKSFDFGYAVDIGNEGNRVVVSTFWLDDGMLGQQGFVQTFVYEQESGKWILDGQPVHSGPFNKARLSPDGDRMVVGSEYDVMYLGSLQTFRYDSSSTNDVPPFIAHPFSSWQGGGFSNTKNSLSRYGLGFRKDQWKKKSVPHLRGVNLHMSD